MILSKYRFTFAIELIDERNERIKQQSFSFLLNNDSDVCLYTLKSNKIDEFELLLQNNIGSVMSDANGIDLMLCCASSGIKSFHVAKEKSIDEKEWRQLLDLLTYLNNGSVETDRFAKHIPQTDHIEDKPNNSAKPKLSSLPFNKKSIMSTFGATSKPKQTNDTFGNKTGATVSGGYKFTINRKGNGSEGGGGSGSGGGVKTTPLTHSVISSGSIPHDAGVMESEEISQESPPVPVSMKKGNQSMFRTSDHLRGVVGAKLLKKEKEKEVDGRSLEPKLIQYKPSRDTFSVLNSLYSNTQDYQGSNATFKSSKPPTVNSTTQSTTNNISLKSKPNQAALNYLEEDIENLSPSDLNQKKTLFSTANTNSITNLKPGNGNINGNINGNGNGNGNGIRNIEESGNIDTNSNGIKNTSESILAKRKLNSTPMTMSLNDKSKQLRVDSILKPVAKTSSITTDSYITSSPSIQEKGFKNLGNTCYMNAVLQSFFGIREIVNDLKGNGIRKYFEDVIEKPSIFRNLLVLLQKKEKIMEHSRLYAYDSLIGGIDTRPFKDTLDDVNPYFKGYSQHDSHEFLLSLMDLLEEELKERLKKENEKIEIKRKEKKLEKELLGQDKVLFNEKEQESLDIPNILKSICPITKNFRSTIHKIITCLNCKDVTQTNEIFTDISLDIAHSLSKTYNIQELLDIYLKEETIERKCQKCSHDKATLAKYFSETPSVLVLHLKRFRRSYYTSNITKDSACILPLNTIQVATIVNKPDLSECNEEPIRLSQVTQVAASPDTEYQSNTTTTSSTTTTSTSTSKSTNGNITDNEYNNKSTATTTTTKKIEQKYNVQSIIQHIGGDIDSGHYVSFVKKSSNYWKLYDDDKVDQVLFTNVMEMILTNGYLYFYIKEKEQ